MDIASMDTEQVVQQMDEYEKIGDLYDYVEMARENYENSGPVITQDDMKVNTYFKKFSKISNTSNKKFFFEGGCQISQDYLDLIDNQSFPTLFKFFTNTEKFTYKDFYSFATNNFIELNADEISFITAKFNPHKYHDIILQKVLNNNHVINSAQFSSLLSQNLNHDFEGVYLDSMLTKYAINNLTTISQENLSELFQKTDLSLSQDYFLEKAIQKKYQIVDNNFFLKFNYQSNALLTQYLEVAVEQQYKNTIIYYSENFTNLCVSYMEQPKDYNTEANIHFERLFVYYNPEKINECHLNEKNLNLVYSKLSEKVSGNNLLEPQNLEFIRSLGFGIYKFLEIFYSKNPDKVIELLDNSNSLFFPYNTNTNFWFQHNGQYDYTALHNILDNSELLNETLQDSFHKNFLLHYLHSEFDNSPIKDRLLKYATYNESFYKILSNSDLFNNKQKNVLIYDMIAAFCYQQLDTKRLFNNLNSFDVSTLENYAPHLEFSLSIIRDVSEHIKDEVTHQFENILLNKKMHIKLNNETEVKSEKRVKI